ncbi:MAG: glutamine synthetase III [Lachnospiraceae bacterium]|nr:glutamine synthetase III [Lachnospiraceae bacterium]
MSIRTNENERFGSNLFHEKAMKQYISEGTLAVWRECVRTRTVLPEKIADDIADGMKRWALDKGATHYTHWFQPLNGETAEKHEGFLIPDGRDGFRMEFSRKELLQGEPDASSFPSGGLRSTFEARGYSAWDPTSYAFIKDKVLCIPTVFCTYSGEVLDKKTPLLRSGDALNRQAVRILRLLGDGQTESVTVNVGAEQEYFLIPKPLFQQREDLRLCGRTLFGADAPKKQELEDHYYGQIKPEITAFMQDLNEELWTLGICAKTEHNEVAPAQYEMAPFFSDANIANDQNQLTMEIMKRVADRHDLVCLLHEKPFAGVNGSGKHVNWSVGTDRGENLFSPGTTPADNTRFLLFLAAFIKGVDEYASLLRCSAAYAGNDQRLGGNEAPPAIISIFVGSELEAVIDSIIRDEPYVDQTDRFLTVGKDVLLQLSKDNTDRNRTSPVAFTGNKFEFRMPGSSQSIAMPVTYLNTILAQELKECADRLEGAEDRPQALRSLIREMLSEHRRILFNGNGYDQSWIAEAERRGLKNLRNTAETIPEFVNEKNVRLLTENGIYSLKEIESRNEIHLESYCGTTVIEARTLLEMIRKGIFGAVSAFLSSLGGDFYFEKELTKKAGSLGNDLLQAAEDLEEALAEYDAAADPEARLKIASEKLTARMAECRRIADLLEKIIDARFWPYPNYTQLMFTI